MQSKATTVAAYLASLPPDRREALEKVRKVILANIDPRYQEGMGYGMMGWSVPHSIFPDGYHCDPRQPLPFAGMASQKNHMSLYLMSLYGNQGEAREFERRWNKTGKRLNMGKCCIRFRFAEDLALDVIAWHIREMPVDKYIEYYKSAILSMNKQAAARAAAKGGGAARKPAGKKPAGKKVAKKSAKKTPRR